MRAVTCEPQATRINESCWRPLDTWQLVALVYMATFRWKRVLWGRTYIIGRERSLESKTGENVVAQERQHSKHNYRCGQENDDAALTLGHTQRIQVHFGGVL